MSDQPQCCLIDTSFDVMRIGDPLKVLIGSGNNDQLQCNIFHVDGETGRHSEVTGDSVKIEWITPRPKDSDRFASDEWKYIAGGKLTVKEPGSYYVYYAPFSFAEAGFAFPMWVLDDQSHRNYWGSIQGDTWQEPLFWTERFDRERLVDIARARRWQSGEISSMKNFLTEQILAGFPPRTSAYWTDSSFAYPKVDLVKMLWLIEVMRVAWHDWALFRESLHFVVSFQERSISFSLESRRPPWLDVVSDNERERPSIVNALDDVQVGFKYLVNFGADKLTLTIDAEGVPSDGFRN